MAEMKNLVCTFFGHKNAPAKIQPMLEKKIIDLIENYGVNKFLVGNQGKFDSIVRKTLKNIKIKYPSIIWFTVLAYMPSKTICSEDYSETIYPDGLEEVFPKYAINKRNQWMIDNSDYVIVYVEHKTGGAAKFKEIAEIKKKIVINIADCELQKLN